MSHAVTVIAMLIALTFNLIGVSRVTPSHAVRRVSPNNIQPSNIPSGIAKEGSQYLHEIAQKANKLSKAQAFLKFISRINTHRHYSSRFSGENF